MPRHTYERPIRFGGHNEYRRTAPGAVPGYEFRHRNDDGRHGDWLPAVAADERGDSWRAMMMGVVGGAEVLESLAAEARLESLTAAADLFPDTAPCIVADVLEGRGDDAGAAWVRATFDPECTIPLGAPVAGAAVTN